MEESGITEEIGRDSRLRAMFFLRVIFLLSIEMRALLAADEVNWERVRTINDINHRLVPAVVGAVEEPDAPMPEHFRSVLAMLADCGFSQVMRDAFDEVRITVREASGIRGLQ